mgnify:CR=1 FL=1
MLNVRKQKSAPGVINRVETEFAGWKVYGDGKLLETKVKSGFEDSTLMGDESCTYQVVAIGKTGKRLSEATYHRNGCTFLFFPQVSQ